jgi:uncharacterized membrane protein
MLSPMRRIWVWLLVLFTVGAFSLFSVAEAQRSGGGVGGRGGFRTSPTPRVNPSPTPTFPTPSPRPDYGYPSPRSYPPVYIPTAPGYGYGGGGVGVASVLVIVVMGVIALSIIQGLRRAGSGLGAYDSLPEAEVARLRLALLYSPSLQRTLRRLAEQADTNTTQGLADLIDEVCVVLLREQAAWRFGSYESWKGSLQQAEGQFDRLMTEDRSKFVETFRKFEGKVERSSDYTPRAEPDGRYLLVSVLVAAHGTLPQVPLPLREAGARAALMALSATTPVTTLAAYVSWTPEAEGESLTEQDLLSGWPELERL